MSKEVVITCVDVIDCVFRIYIKSEVGCFTFLSVGTVHMSVVSCSFRSNALTLILLLEDRINSIKFNKIQ